MRHANVTFDPAPPACDMPGRLRTPANLAGGVQGAGIRPASLPRQRPSADASQVCRVLEGPPAGRVGAYRIRPPGATIGGEYTSPGYDHSSLAGASGTPAKFAVYPASFAGVRRRPPLHRVRAFGSLRVPGQLPCLGRGFTALPRPGRWGVCWASSRRPTRGERRRRRGLRAARSAGC